MWILLSDEEKKQLESLTSNSGNEVLAALGRRIAEFQAEQATPAAQKYLKLAQDGSKDGECEVDGSAIVSMGEDNGAYVMAWVWYDNPDKEEED